MLSNMYVFISCMHDASVNLLPYFWSLFYLICSSLLFSFFPIIFPSPTLLFCSFFYFRSTYFTVFFPPHILFHESSPTLQVLSFSLHSNFSITFLFLQFLPPDPFHFLLLLCYLFILIISTLPVQHL